MSRNQWGNGYYKGARDALTSGSVLINKPIHTLKDGKIHNQGVIIQFDNIDAHPAQEEPGVEPTPIPI